MQRLARSTDGGRIPFAVRSFQRGSGPDAQARRRLTRLAGGSILLACAWILLAPASFPQRPDGDSKDEAFEKVDPYTKGAREALDRAGYVSLGPFPLFEGVKTGDVEETLGGIPILWAETAHFRIGSTLATYKFKGDSREERRIKVDLEHLAGKLDPFHPPPGRLDPWLRLHLYAQRVEEQYADFCALFGFKDEDFEARKLKPLPGMGAAMGEGPFLGQEMKFTVLLAEKSSSLGRFVGRWMRRAPSDSYRECLPGGSMFLGTSAQTWREFGYELDSTLHCVVANDLAWNLVDGLRKSWFAPPLWLKQGIAYWSSRRIDERFAVYATGTQRRFDDDSWRWEPRVRGLVANQFAAPWRTMMGWQATREMKPQDHMIAWSRVSWLLSQKSADLHAFLMVLSESVLTVPAPDRPKVVLERQGQAFAAGFGKTPEELEEAWKQFVLKTYPKK